MVTVLYTVPQSVSRKKLQSVTTESLMPINQCIILMKNCGELQSNLDETDCTYHAGEQTRSQI